MTKHIQGSPLISLHTYCEVFMQDKNVFWQAEDDVAASVNKRTSVSYV